LGACVVEGVRGEETVTSEADLISSSHWIHPSRQMNKYASVTGDEGEESLGGLKDRPHLSMEIANRAKQEGPSK